MLRIYGFFSRIYGSLFVIATRSSIALRFSYTYLWVSFLVDRLHKPFKSCLFGIPTRTSIAVSVSFTIYGSFVRIYGSLLRIYGSLFVIATRSFIALWVSFTYL